MNIHMVIEGEKAMEQVYRTWIPVVNSQLIYVSHITKTIENNYSIVKGFGYPSYFDVIEGAIDDINTLGNLIDRLVIVVDSEEMSYTDKQLEIRQFLSNHVCNARIFIVIQHFCFEAWALGNKKAFPKTIRSAEMLEYKKRFNVLSDDPELLPDFPKYRFNRSQFAYSYLQRMLREKHHHLCYNKAKSDVVAHSKYLKQLIERNKTTHHIRSIQSFIDAFS